MKQKKLLLCFATFLFGASALTFAQDASSSSGGNASGSGGSAAYTVGQTFYTTNSGTNHSVAQGVQQPFEISVVTGSENINVSLNIYANPNPTTDYLLLQTSEHINMQYQLFDINGKLIDSKGVTNEQTRIAMQQLPSATYILKITQSNKELKSFKITKN